MSIIGSNAERSANKGSCPKRGRPRGFARWNPHADTLALLQCILAVLAEYQEHLPLTCRQIFYRLVAMFGFDKTEAAYSRLCETIGRARRARLIRFEDIRDDGTDRYESQTWDDLDDFLDDMRGMAKRFRLDRQRGQEVRLWVLCEAGGMAPMLARVANPYGVPVASSGGFDSLTAKYALAQELAAEVEVGGRAEVLHIGDLDPSGVHLFTSLAEDVTAMVREMAGAEPLFTRLAVTPEQVRQLNLPTAPPKTTDKRAFEGETVQCEAIAPDVLTELLRDAIEARRCADATDDVLTAEAEYRADLLGKLDGMSEASA